MRHGLRSAPAHAAGGNARLLVAVGLAALVALGLMAGSASAMKVKPPKTVWLCKPGLKADPCTTP